MRVRSLLDSTANSCHSNHCCCQSIYLRPSIGCWQRSQELLIDCLTGRLLHIYDCVVLNCANARLSHCDCISVFVRWKQDIYLNSEKNARGAITEYVRGREYLASVEPLVASPFFCCVLWQLLLLASLVLCSHCKCIFGLSVRVYVCFTRWTRC